MEITTAQSPTVNLSTAPPNEPMSIKPPDSQIKAHRPLWIMIVLILFLLAILVGGVWGYFKYYKLAYSDSTYGFIIKDQRGWYGVPKKEGVYYSIGTSDSSAGKVISYIGVSPIIHINSDNAAFLEKVKDSCDETAQELGTTFVDSSLITINNLQGLLCTSEGKATNIDKIYTLRQYYLITNAGKYDYIVTTSYPKGDMLEEEKVNHILKNFYAK